VPVEEEDAPGTVLGFVVRIGGHRKRL
jgi:hypothetical protein